MWNPYIRKIKTITGTTLIVKECDTFKSDIGFAYHSQNNDYKIVRVVLWKQNVIEAEVYTLSTDMWRKVEVSLESLSIFGTDDFIFRRVEIKTHLLMELSIGQFVKIIDTGIYHLMLILRDLERLCRLFRIT